MRILLAEDEPDLLEALKAILEHSRYTVDAVDNGTDALSYAMTGQYDGLILDIMMPGMDGVAVLEKLRASRINTPALFLTAKTQVDDRIRGLDAGADDYISKPFDMGELLARVRAMMRRKEEFAPNELKYGDLILSRTDFSIRTENGTALTLSGREFQMLEMLMLDPGKVISPERFMDSIWSDSDVESDIVWVYISNLRKKLKSAGSFVEIRSLRGLGYTVACPSAE
ncbi:MAG: response regulator transcription factor [Lachnospiraceae bacterium]|nr:response regulator transcription factor [Lachnospiraceae bacterium]